MSGTTIAPAELLFPAREIAAAAGMEPHELKTYEPLGFGVPGHWRLLDTGGVVYTEKGVLELADEMERRQLVAIAHTLRVLVKQRKETPSRALVPPRRKDAPWYQTGSMA